MTVFPWVDRSPTYLIASGVSLSGKVRSMTGVTLPASRSSCRTTRSSLFGLEKNERSRWPTNGDTTTALRVRPIPMHQRPLGGERPPEMGQRTVPSHLQDQVITLPSAGEILLGVIDYMVGADRAD